MEWWRCSRLAEGAPNCCRAAYHCDSAALKCSAVCPLDLRREAHQYPSENTRLWMLRINTRLTPASTSTESGDSNNQITYNYFEELE